MKNEQLKGNSISESLLNKNTYYVLLSSREIGANLRCDIAMLRKAFFENKRKTLKIAKEVTTSGVEGYLTGKITKNSLTWKKTEGGINTEECYKNKGVYVLVNRDLNGNIKNKIYYNKNMLWIKTEYFSVNDFANAEIIFKPVNTENAIERFTYDREKKNYVSTLLYPIPYDAGSEERSLLDAALPEEKLLVSTEDGEFIYCAKSELEGHTKLQEDIKESINFLNSVWQSENITDIEPVSEPEVKTTEITDENEIPETNQEKALPEETKEEEASPEETNIEETAKEIKAESESPSLCEENTEIIAETKENIPEEQTKDEIIPQEETAEPKMGKLEIEETYTSDNGEKYGEKLVYTGTLIEGKRNGRGRTDRKSGLTAFDGEYSDNKREGFGCSYYKNGNLSYAGFWKDDKKNGMGVSFRNSDSQPLVNNYNYIYFC